MRLKVLCAVLSVLLAGTLFLDHDVVAKRYSSGGSSRIPSLPGYPSGSKPFGPPSSGYGNSGIKPETGKNPATGGYGNSGVKPPGAVSTPPGSPAPPSGYGNSATPLQGKGEPAGAGQTKMTALQQQMNRSFSKQESARAYEDYKTQQSKFQMSSKGAYTPSTRETATINSTQSRAAYGSGSDYYARRTVFYDAYRWSPPVYMYGSYSSFGIWDAMILWFMLDHVYDAQYAAMYYNHRDDPGMQQFRSELDRLSAENAELKDKVAKLDESAKSLEQQGVKPDPAYVPQDAAAIALAADIASKEAPKSGGFPWTWVIGIGSVVLIASLLRRRK
jgi:hypothetical protein